MRRPRGVAPRAVSLFASAKVNLGWRVGPVRDDGYHEVSGCLHTVSLHDELAVSTRDVKAEAGLHLDVEGPEASGLEAETDNLVARAGSLLVERYDLDPPPTSVTLTKRIPVAAGLGGGSADAAAALTGLALAWGLDLSARDLLRLAAELGSDVPAILIGGLVHASGRGESVRNVGCLTGPDMVLGLLPAALPTRDVYRRLDELRASGAASRGDDFVANDLQSAAADLEPLVAQGLEAMRAAGAFGAFVSGSGPTVVGTFADARSAADVAARQRPPFHRLIPVRPTGWGVRLRLTGRRSN